MRSSYLLPPLLHLATQDFTQEIYLSSSSSLPDEEEKDDDEEPSSPLLSSSCLSWAALRNLVRKADACDTCFCTVSATQQSSRRQDQHFATGAASATAIVLAAPAALNLWLMRSAAPAEMGAARPLCEAPARLSRMELLAPAAPHRAAQASGESLALW